MAQLTGFDWIELDNELDSNWHELNCIIEVF